MSETDARLESMLFDYGSTYLTDFRKVKFKKPVLTTYIPKPPKKRDSGRISPPPLKDCHTHFDWKEGKTVPFNLFHKPKDIIGCNPRALQKPYAKPVDTGLEQARKTRPRLVITPAVSIDDADDKARAIICEAMYTTDIAKALRDAVSPYFSVKAPLPKLPSPSNPVGLRKLQAPFVSPEWRMDSVSWDNRQLRTYCDPTMNFWLEQKLPRCRACEESTAVAAHRKLQHSTAVKRS